MGFTVVFHCSPSGFCVDFLDFTPLMSTRTFLFVVCAFKRPIESFKWGLFSEVFLQVQKYVDLGLKKLETWEKGKKKLFKSRWPSWRPPGGF